MRAQREVRLGRSSTPAALPASVEAGHGRALDTVFGEVTVERLAYRRRGEANLHPADASLNLPEEKHSHGLRRLSAIEATHAAPSTGPPTPSNGRPAKRWASARWSTSPAGGRRLSTTSTPSVGVPDGDREDALVISVDAKGIVMRTEALRQATEEAAESSSPKMLRPGCPRARSTGANAWPS